MLFLWDTYRNTKVILVSAHFYIKAIPSDPKIFLLLLVKLSVSLDVAGVAECHKIFPL